MASPAVTGAIAAPNYWAGGNGNWTDGTKWSLGYPPAGGDSVWLIAASGAVVYDAASAGGYGPVTIDSTGGGSLGLSVGQGTLVSQLVIVGQFNAGSLDLSGGSVSTPTIVVGMNKGSVGTFNLYSGSLAVDGTAYVGYSGQGYFNQGAASGNTTSTGGAFQTVNLCLGYNAGSNGVYNLYGGSLTVTGSVNVGYNGAGSFYQSGGIVKVYNDLVIGSMGSYDFEGGRLRVAGTLLNNGALTANGNPLNGDLFQVGTLVQAGGVLQGSGTITGNVSVTGGAVHPGNSPGVLTIAGNYTQSAGTLSIDIANDGSHGQLVVLGQARLAGYLYVSLLPGAGVYNGEKFDIVNAALLFGTLLPEGPLFTVAPNGFYFSLEITPTDIFLVANGDSGAAASSVPSPSGLLLLAPGLAGLAALRRRFGK